MKIKTSELSGMALDWAAAVADGWVPDPGSPKTLRKAKLYCCCLPYSESWELGGPIIERERITISQGRDLIASIWIDEYGVNGGYKFKQTGPTPLIAAMRTFVRSTSGEEVDVPEALL